MDGDGEGRKLELICPVLENNEEIYIKIGFSGGANGKESSANAGDVSLIPGSGRPTGGGRGNTLQYSCPENSMDSGAWWAAVNNVAQLDTTEVI